MKLTKLQRRLLEKQYTDLENERKVFWAVSIVLIIFPLGFFHYILSWSININTIFIWIGGMLAINIWRKSKLDKKTEGILFKLAGK